MPVVHCPVPDCEYETADLDAVVIAALLTAHAIVHSANTGDNISANLKRSKHQLLLQRVLVKIGLISFLGGKTMLKPLKYSFLRVMINLCVESSQELLVVYLSINLNKTSL